MILGQVDLKSTTLLDQGRVAKITSVVFLSLCLLILGCNKDQDPKKNQPPDSKISLHAIDREGENRLPSTVELKWSGTDKDGFVKGYELSFDANEWFFTQKTDSTFNFRIKEGSKQQNIEFFVRAVDNEGHKDPDPAKLTIPIKNRPPEARFKVNEMPDDTAYTVFPVSWIATDPDGGGTIDSILLKVNDGRWFLVDPSTRFTTLVPKNPGQTARELESTVYKGIQPEKLEKPIQGLVLGAKNRFYIKAKDIAGSGSGIDTTEFYVKPKTSDLLVLGATSSSPQTGNVFKPKIRNVYGNFDFINYYGNNNFNPPQFWNSVFRFRIELYDKVFLYTDDSKVEGDLFLEAAGSAFQQFLNKDGKLLISTEFPNDLRANSNIFSYSPMDRPVNSDGQARIPPDSLLEPTPSADNYDTLQSSDFLVAVDPFYPKQSAKVLYKAQLAKLQGWEGPNTVVASTSKGGNVNQVFSSVPLEVMNKRKANLEQFFEHVLNDAFDW